MTGKYIYPLNNIHQDFAYEIALSLFYGRQNKQISLEQAACKSGLSIEEIDALECANADLDFSKIIKLLDIYDWQINGSPEGLDKLPEAWRKKYFNY